MFKKIVLFKKFVGPEVWKYFLISAVVGLLWFGVESSFIFVFQGFLSAIGLISKEKQILPQWYPDGLGPSMCILVLFGIFRSGILMLRNHFASLTQVTFNSRQRLTLLSFGLRNIQQISSKQLVYLFSEITTQAGSVIFSSSMLINTGLAALLFLIAGFKLAPYEMLIGIGSLLLFMLPMKYFMRRINKAGVGLVKEGENLNESLLRGIKNNFLLTAYNQVEKEIDKSGLSLQNYKRHYMGYSMVAGISSAFPLALGVIIISLIAFISVTYIHTAPMQLVSFFYIFIRLAQAASDTSFTLANIKLALPGILSLFEAWKKFDIAPKVQTKHLIEANDITIEARDLAFAYDSKNFLFQDINFKIGRSDVLVIKGESGVGKSTLLSILLGFYKPTLGEIRINTFTTQDQVFDLHKVLAYVGPEPYLIEGSIRENLLYALDRVDKVTDEEIWQVLERVDLHSLIGELPQKLDEHISEIPKFSTGQKQRLSFARALIRKPSLLILDEATANLDVATEGRILKNLNLFLNSCTTIVVTHKSSFDEIATIKIRLGES